MDRVTGFTSFNGPEAQLVCARLRTAGFQASVEGEAAAFSMEAGFVYLNFDLFFSFCPNNP